MIPRLLSLLCLWLGLLFPVSIFASFGAGPEAGSREYNAASRTWSTEYGSDTDEVKLYKVGLPQLISGPAGDQRELKWENFQVKSEEHTGGTWSGAVVEQDYDDKGHASSSEVSPPAGASATFDTTPDLYGRPGTISGPSGFSGGYQYYPDGQFKRFTRGPLTTTWTYDAEGRVDTVTTVNTSGPDFAYDHNFNSKNLRTSRLASGAGSSWTGLYYDQAHQLKGAAGFDYNYDSRGNRTAGGGGAEIWTVNGLDQATGRTLGQRRYGVTGSVAPGATVRVTHPGAPNGEVVPVDPVTGAYSASWIATSSGSGVERVEMLVRGTLAGAGTSGTDAVADKLVWAVVPAASEVLDYDGAGRLVGDNLWTYTWDARGKLTGMTRKAGTFSEPSITSEELSFRYDAEGRRVRKLHTVTYQNASTKISESKLLWNGWLPAMEDRTVDGVAQPRRWFVWGRDQSDTWNSAGGIGGLAAIIEEGGRTLLPVDDGLGNIMAVVNAADGEMVASFDYGPYGEPLGQSGDVNACPFRYQSKYLDTETGLSYFGYRYYSAKLGRWISRDPLGESGGFNLYGYCGNDPVNGWDYLGMQENSPPEGNIIGSFFELFMPSVMAPLVKDSEHQRMLMLRGELRHNLTFPVMELGFQGVTRGHIVGLNALAEKMEEQANDIVSASNSPEGQFWVPAVGAIGAGSLGTISFVTDFRGWVEGPIAWGKDGFPIYGPTVCNIREGYAEKDWGRMFTGIANTSGAMTMAVAPFKSLRNVEVNPTKYEFSLLRGKVPLEENLPSTSILADPPIFTQKNPLVFIDENIYFLAEPLAQRGFQVVKVPSAMKDSTIRLAVE